MQVAIDEAREGIFNGDGGPFGSVIVKDGKIVGQGHNMVLANNDSTCHGEIAAIRGTEQAMGTYDLSGCELYTTAEPCPMCLGGILWANIKKVHYGCNRIDTDSLGFRDEVFYEYLEGKTDLLDMKEDSRNECLTLFDFYKNLENKTVY